MSEQAERERREKRGWAAPGGSHDKVIRLLKLALPALIGVVLAFLFFSPLEEKQEVSFLLDKNKVGTAEERLKVSAAQYRGQDDAGRPFVLSAQSALQANSQTQVVEISGLSARILLDNGPAGFRANRARYNMQNDHVDVVGPILFTAADGYRMGTRDVTVNMRTRTLASRGPVEGQMPLGRFSADQLRVNLPDRTVVLEGRARLHIVQGGIR
jgi:lipopolysaccharide export system protein LptC